VKSVQSIGPYSSVQPLGPENDEKPASTRMWQMITSLSTVPVGAVIVNDVPVEAPPVDDARKAGEAML
jgi:hypothetical protein